VGDRSVAVVVWRCLDPVVMASSLLEIRTARFARVCSRCCGSWFRCCVCACWEVVACVVRMRERCKSVGLVVPRYCPAA
jgi:hypothetical protein